jgi:site-specific DNA-methyltransferase (adenine-specific)
MIQQKMGRGKEARIHPTQKPQALYRWILESYAEPGQRILDTHLGSGSSAIAAHYFGCDFVGTEIDPDYFKAAQARFDSETKQL